ncbi:hypothetical protein P9112_012932 [Eukaryota sp. TZLM1-RC]
MPASNVVATHSGYVVVYDTSIFFFESSTQQYYPLLSNVTPPIRFDSLGQIIFSPSSTKLHIFSATSSPQLRCIHLPFTIINACISNEYLVLAPSDFSTSNLACLYASPLSSITSGRFDPSLAWALHDSRTFTSLLPLPLSSPHMFGYILCSDNRGRVLLLVDGVVVTILRGKRNACLGLFDRFCWIYSPKLGVFEYFSTLDLKHNCFLLSIGDLNSINSVKNLNFIDSHHFLESQGQVKHIGSILKLNNQKFNDFQGNFLTSIENSLSFIIEPSDTEKVQKGIEILGKFEREAFGSQLITLKKLKNCLSLYFSLSQSLYCVEHRGEKISILSRVRSKLKRSISINDILGHQSPKKSRDRSKRCLTFWNFSQYLLNFEPSQIFIEFYSLFHLLITSNTPGFIIKDVVDGLYFVFESNLSNICDFLLNLFKSIQLETILSIDLRQVAFFVSELLTVTKNRPNQPSLNSLIFDRLSQVSDFNELVSFFPVAFSLEGHELLYHCFSDSLILAISTERFKIAVSFELISPKQLLIKGTVNCVAAVFVSQYGDVIGDVTSSKISKLFYGLSVNPNYVEFIQICAFESIQFSENNVINPNCFAFLKLQFNNNLSDFNPQLLKLYQDQIDKIGDLVFNSFPLSLNVNFLLCHHQFYSFLHKYPVIFDLKNLNLVFNSKEFVKSFEFKSSLLSRSFLLSFIYLSFCCGKLTLSDLIDSQIIGDCQLITPENQFDSIKVVRLMTLFLVPPIIIHRIALNFFKIPNYLAIIADSLSCLLNVASQYFDRNLFNFVSEFKSITPINCFFDCFLEESRHRISIILQQSNYSLPLLLSKCDLSRSDALWLLTVNGESQSEVSDIDCSSVHSLISFLKGHGFKEPRIYSVESVLHMLLNS